MGCTHSTSPTDAPGLGGARIAVAVSYQDSDLDNTHGGALILVADDGTVRSIDTSGMDNMRLAWTGTSVAYSDQQGDHLLGSKLVTQPRASEQQSQVSLEPTAAGVRAVFNTGQGEGAYEVAVTNFGDTGSTTETLTGVQPSGVSRCADGDYLFGTLDSDGSGRTLSFRALDAALRVQSRDFHLALSPAIGADAPACLGHTMYAVMVDGDVDGESTPSKVLLATMNLDDGSVRTVPLVTTGGRSPLKLGFDEVGRGTMRPVVVEGRWLDWVAGASGRVYRTAIATGSTQVVRDGMPSDIWSDAVYSFEGGRLVVLSGAVSGDFVLRTYALEEAWRDESSQALPALADAVGDRLVRSVLAIPAHAA